MAEKNVEKARKHEVEPENEKSKKQPLAMLYLFKILYENTDENHGLTAQNIIDLLKADGIILQRQAVVRYMNLLGDEEFSNQFGVGIELPGRGSRDGYRMSERPFDIAELKMLADAVASARFINENTAGKLMEKLGNLASKEQNKELKRNVFVEGRVKTQSDNVTNSVDWIHKAIASKKKITFDYCEYDITKKLQKRGETRECTPYALVWSDDRYYLVANHPKYGIANYRVDRMKKVRLLEDKNADPIPKEYQKFNGKVSAFNTSKYLKTTFSMFSGTDGEVKLRFDKKLVGVVLDKFGYETRIIPDGNDHFKVNVEVRSEHPEAFFGWLFKFGTDAEILAPADLKQKYSEMLQSVLDSNNSSK